MRVQSFIGRLRGFYWLMVECSGEYNIWMLYAKVMTVPSFTCRWSSAHTRDSIVSILYANVIKIRAFFSSYH